MDPSAATVETWERRPGAACASLGGSRRREPERTLLHTVVRERLEPFLAAARDRSPSGRGLPAHVERDLRAYLDCGILARGFARVRCPGCGFERLVHDVFPRVPVRQWVLSKPSCPVIPLFGTPSSHSLRISLTSSIVTSRNAIAASRPWTGAAWQ